MRLEESKLDGALRSRLWGMCSLRGAIEAMLLTLTPRFGVIFRPCGRINVKDRRYFPSVVDKKTRKSGIIELFSSHINQSVT